MNETIDFNGSQRRIILDLGVECMKRDDIHVSFYFNSKNSKTFWVVLVFYPKVPFCLKGLEAEQSEDLMGKASSMR